ncbi:MAG: hypothetical protein GQ547_02665 [Methylophaga sp.]|nr:hypothetical protein [Methylophaga sp.]
MTLSRQHQIIIGLVLIALMIITRAHHFSTFTNLPSASWATFFLAGLYLSSKWTFPALLIIAGFIDYFAITWTGVSSYCVSPAYPLLIPAYGSLWLAGAWYAKQYQFTLRTLVPLSIALTMSIALCTLISSGGFYFFSGRYAEPTFIELGHRFVQYFPSYLANGVFHISIAAICHSLIISLNKSTHTPSNESI